MEAQREEISFDDAVLTHRRLLIRSALRMTGSSSEAEDLVQETLLKAYRAFDRLRPNSQTRAWLLRILRNTSISAWRRRHRERDLLQQSVAEDNAEWLHPHAFDELEKGLPADDLGDEVLRALEEVPPNYRACVLWVDLHQKSYQETAALTKQPLGTVQSRLHRGRKILKGLLRDYAQQEGYLTRAA
jgi:RNA polymerase sigma-70 factor, ECF subfamily